MHCSLLWILLNCDVDIKHMIENVPMRLILSSCTLLLVYIPLKIDAEQLKSTNSWWHQLSCVFVFCLLSLMLLEYICRSRGQLEYFKRYIFMYLLAYLLKWAKSLPKILTKTTKPKMELKSIGFICWWYYCIYSRFQSEVHHFMYRWITIMWVWSLIILPKTRIVDAIGFRYF